MILRFFVAGVPQGQPRAKAYLRGNRAGVYTPGGQHRTWRELVLMDAKQNGTIKLDGPVFVDLAFVFPRPKSHYTKKGLRPDAPAYHTTRPDADNLAKLVMDAISELGWWANDWQVADLRVRKLYHDDDGGPGCHIEIGHIYVDVLFDTEAQHHDVR